MKRTTEECKNAVIAYVKRHKSATIDEIEKKSSVNVHRIFGGIREAFKESGISYPRKTIESKTIEKIAEEFRNNPLLTVEEIQGKYNISFYKKFKSFEMFCKKYGIEYISRHQKRLLKKKAEVIDYIKKHPNSTQWEINKNCRTHVQDIFDNGIIEAFRDACVEYPDFRRKIFGSANRHIRRRAIRFENSIFRKLDKIGRLQRYVEINGKIVDGVLHTKDKKFVIEIKNYLSKPISKSEINQLMNYMRLLNCRDGVLICNKKGNKGKVQIGSYNISIITEDELMGSWSSWV